MKDYPQAWVGYRKGWRWWFHNLIVLMDRLDRAPKVSLLAAAAGALALCSLTWPGWRLAAALIAGAALIIEERVLAWGLRTGRAPTPFGGPFAFFTLGHAGATALAGALPLPLGWLFSAHVVIQASLLGAMLYASLLEPFNVVWREVEAEVPARRHEGTDEKAAERLEGTGRETTLKILLISDLHLDRRGLREERALRLAREYGPDLVLWPGDFTNLSFVGHEGACGETREIIRELCALAPVYASLGTHEVDRKDWVEELLRGTDAVLLDHDIATVRIRGVELHLIGIPFVGGEEKRVQSLDRLLARADGRPVILLHHSPDIFVRAAQRNVSLHVAGHTHGGQISLPLLGPLYTNSRYGKKYAWGTHRLGDTTLVVSRGIGMEGAGAPRMRFLCPPEVVGIRLKISG
ncbi:MAG TPA: metallophosphoesterase [bacterium]|nr:metallophosphoesterase [bacterium]